MLAARLSGVHRVRAEAMAREGHVWVWFWDEHGRELLAMHMPTHPNAYEAAQAIAMAYNSVQPQPTKEGE